jgi:hypothetical protein
MRKLLAPGVRLGDFLTPEVVYLFENKNSKTVIVDNKTKNNMKHSKM